MKKRTLLFIPMLFSGLLIGCGMSGPLYRAPEKPQKIEKQTTKTEIEVDKTDKTS